jgi:hypothetical protein
MVASARSASRRKLSGLYCIHKISLEGCGAPWLRRLLPGKRRKREQQAGKFGRAGPRATRRPQDSDRSAAEHFSVRPDHPIPLLSAPAPHRQAEFQIPARQGFAPGTDDRWRRHDKTRHGLRVIPQTVDHWRVSAIDTELDRRSLANPYLNSSYPPYPSRDGYFPRC